MHAYGSLFRCQAGDTLPSHVTFDAGIARKLSEQELGSVDIGILKDILMVDYGAFKPVVMKVAWVKQRDQGRSTIKKDRHGFWMAKLDCMDFGENHNQYVFPEHVSQVFFMDDQRDPTWKVVLSHEPRSKRETGEHDHTMFVGTGQRVDSDGIIPRRLRAEVFQNSNADLQTPVAEVPLPAVDILEALQIPAQDDAVYDDDQYEDDYMPYDGP